ncbi:hypothetical protein CDAR_88251 [Caerostris darwini]|uniref:Uncharacterized protein n=1 Tax=Caerostris darwini TaxID=1538125 RepID=A0AAV4TB74_9ARAC|nr:hypothetical protein CDAR_88251 [Caerostris darwini]
MASRYKSIAHVHFGGFFPEEKSKRVEQQNQVKQEILNDAEYDQSISHTELVKKSEDCRNIEEQLKAAESKLKAYRCLPTSIQSTEVEIQEKQITVEVE